MDIDRIFSKHQPGPFTGMGDNGRRNPFNGLVEDTAQLRCKWIADAARAAGADLATLNISYAGVPLTFMPVKVGFGTRYFWRCPICGGRVEVMYRRGARVGCRECLHLGYRSQVSRNTSRWRMLSDILDRRWPPPRYGPDDSTAKAIAEAFRPQLEAFLSEQAAAIEITLPE